MKKPIYIRKASGNEQSVAAGAVSAGGGVATSAINAANPLGWINTLVGGVTSIVSTITGGIINLGVTRSNNDKEVKEVYWMTRKDRETEMDNNMGFYIIVGLIVVAAAVAFIVNSKKSK